MAPMLKLVELRLPYHRRPPFGCQRCTPARPTACFSLQWIIRRSDFRVKKIDEEAALEATLEGRISRKSGILAGLNNGSSIIALGELEK